MVLESDEDPYKSVSNSESDHKSDDEDYRQVRQRNAAIKERIQKYGLNNPPEMDTFKQIREQSIQNGQNN